MSVAISNSYNRIIEEAIRNDLTYHSSYSTNSLVYNNGANGSFVTYQPTYASGAMSWPGVGTAVAPPQPQGSNVNSRTGTVQVQAGFVGQVYVTDPTNSAKVILWESEPKKTLAKADKAAKKAQVRAAKRSFE